MEENAHLKYVQEYKRFIEFWHRLKMMIKIKNLTIEILIKKLMYEVNNLLKIIIIENNLLVFKHKIDN
jgi:hypothetical protein